MKKALFVLLFIIATFCFFPATAAAESVKKFDATYNLDKSGFIQVVEKIQYDFGSEYLHGIYRYVPYVYKLDNGDTVHINLSDFKVVDNKGYSYTFEKYTENNNVVLKIGDADKTITGPHTYVISYKVKGGLKYLDSGDEFYWNVNGTGWKVPTGEVTATVNYPKEVDRSSVKYDCYTGVYGSGAKCDQAELADGTVTYRASKLGAGQGLTLVANFPKGTFEVMDAGFMGSGYSYTTIIAMVLIALIFPLVTFIFMLRHWWKYGRDAKGRGTIIAEYNAPDGVTPIEMGALLDGRVNSKDLSAEIIYLATRGYLKIKREPGNGIFKKDDYTLIKLADPAKNTPHFDQVLFTGIFGALAEIKVSALKEDFYTNMPTIKSAVHTKMVTDGYFKEKIASTIGKYVGIAIGVGLVGFGLAVVVGWLTNGLGSYIFAPAFIISAIIIALFGVAMPARTAKGVDIKERTLGLKEYLRVAESDRIKFHNAPKKDPTQFEKLLPYAMVLGVEKEWAKQFEGIFKENPGWYDDPSGRIFVPMVFVNNLGSFNTVVTQNMTTAPSSSGSGIGGGFSGGGFGGGGGGSW